MTTPYNGNANGVAARAVPTISISVDADDLNSALLNTPLITLADVAAFLQAYAALLGSGRQNNDTLTVNGADDHIPALLSAGPLGANAYKLIHEMAGFDTVRRRRYVGLTGGAACILDTVNAYWNGQAFVRDTSAADAVLWRVSGSQAQFQVWQAGQSGWDAAITMSRVPGGGGALTLQNGAIAFTGTSVGGFGASNPGVGVASANRLVAKNICKAFGSIQLGSPPVWLDGFNVQDPIATPDANTIQVSFAAPMNAYYTVIPSCSRQTVSGDLRIPDVFGKGTASFRMRLLDRNGAPTAVNVAGLTPQIDFVVFGPQDT